MINLLLKFLALVVIGELIALYSIGGKKAGSKILSESTILTSTATPTETPTPTPEPTLPPTPTPTPTQTPTPIPQPVFSSQQINEFIDRFAAQYNVSPDIMRYIALCESGFNPFAKHVGYAGLYQFGPITWKNIRKEMGEDTDPNLRLNAEEAVQTAAYILHINKAYLWPNCIP